MNPIEWTLAKEDKILEIIKSMSRPVLVLLVLMSATVASAEGDSYWAVAQAMERIGESSLARYSNYGAAWNYTRLEEAEKAAMETCRKRTPDEWNERRWPGGGCKIQRYGKNSCFYIIRRDTDDKYLGKYTGFGASRESYPSKAVAEAAAKRSAADNFTNDPHVIVTTGAVELVKCSGVQ